MFNAKQKIKNYMKEKNQILKNKTGLNLYYKGDYQDINKLTSEQAKNIIKELKKIKHVNDTAICPQCITFFDFYRCTDCTYRKRHEKCSSDNNRNQYNKIINKTMSVALSDQFCHQDLKTFFQYL